MVYNCVYYCDTRTCEPPVYAQEVGDELQVPQPLPLAALREVCGGYEVCCMGVWVYGCMGVWVYGCMGV
jgi:hypothetical protein